MKKALVTGFLFIILLSSSIFIYYYSIWNEDQSIKAEMRQKAISEVSILKDIEDVHLFTGEEQYYVIMGNDHLGNPLIIWLNEEETHYQILKQSITKEEVSILAAKRESEIIIKRVTPGVLANDTLIYEVLFQDKAGRFGYQYYNLENGQFIKMIKLGKSV